MEQRGVSAELCKRGTQKGSLLCRRSRDSSYRQCQPRRMKPGQPLLKNLKVDVRAELPEAGRKVDANEAGATAA
jgi:hypothetical protein